VSVPYLQEVRFLPERVPDAEAFPFTLPFLRDLTLELRSPVTFFVGENGTGKSTLLEAIAVLCRFPVSGGGFNELGDNHGPERDSPLASALRPAFRRRHRAGYFLRGEFHAHFASLLDARAADPDFLGNPYARYGGRSLHTRSHGEAFLAVLDGQLGPGLFLFDEPESALSPQRQLALLARMADVAAQGSAQFIVATHSPILLTYPDADIVSFDGDRLTSVRLEDTSHYQITHGILQNPQRYWKHLVDRGDK
jgi:predicted ATPase